jgi:DNA mismatch endonuclease (patch repair protein)
MADIVDRATRSRMMAGIRGKNTFPERRVRSFLHRAGLRFSLHRPDLPGHPDIVLPRWNAVVFVHGCFWHRHHGCRMATVPATRKAFWARKFASNVERDRRHCRDLRRMGWRYRVIWECELDRAHLRTLVRWVRSVPPVS